MNDGHFAEQLEYHDQWKKEIVRGIEVYEEWLSTDHDAQLGLEQRILELRHALCTDRLTIAFVGEFSRGKTELINALFFAEHRRRLLPSEAGRTTMCPTEIFYDDREPKPYLKLLPIESRLNDRPIAELKRDPTEWRSVELNVSSAEALVDAFREVARTKAARWQEANALGLLTQQPYHSANSNSKPYEKVEIPRWRHALISFPHPLLRQGLSILDTPGLNALGNEPELTLSMLASAQAVIFVLAADTGVTATDMEIWQHHVRPLCGDADSGLIVVLNKVDMLWDELRDSSSISAAIRGVSNTTAKQLQIANERVFALSAQKALLGKIRGDEALLAKSGLLKLEAELADVLLPAKQHLLRDNIINEFSHAVMHSRDEIRIKLEKAQQQLAELTTLEGKSAKTVRALMQKTEQAQENFKKNMIHFQSSHRLHQRHAEILLKSLDIEDIDKQIEDTRQIMIRSWTTQGLKKTMQAFFEGIQATMEQADREAERGQKLVDAIYRKFHNIQASSESTEVKVKTLRQVCTDFETELGKLEQTLRALRRPLPCDCSAKVVHLPLIGKTHR
jgi:GTPase SAR1 family protein